jgi:hypothetical protein
VALSNAEFVEAHINLLFKGLGAVQMRKGNQLRGSDGAGQIKNEYLFNL